ncbi:MAG: MipA/OmpV family protein [SAR324 cluster bacterium]|nr:MipA/OmpV family protein [SAR324 cluster bacterium]
MTHRLMCIIWILAGLLVSLFPFSVWAGNQPKWEAGIGVFHAQLPHYLGSNHYYRLTVPFPVFIYRFDVAELGQGSKLLLWDGDRVVIDIGLSGRLPVESAPIDANSPTGANNSGAEIIQIENYTRRGMEDLPLTFFGGVRTKVYFTDHLLLELPVLNGFTVGGGFGHVGNIYTPELSYDFFGRDSNDSMGLSVSWRHGDENYNNYYYGVKEADAIEGRSEYRANPGLVALTYGFGGFFNLTEEFAIGLGYFINDLKHSIVRNSPLVISQQSRSFTIGFIYRFLQSSQFVRTWK